MATLNINTTALTTTNRARINLYKESAPDAIVSSLTYDAPHGERTWVFFNLEANANYRYRWIEIDAAGATLQQYASQWFTTPPTGTLKHRPTEYLEAGVTVGMVSGASSAIFDGTGGKPDFRDWSITVDKPGFGDQYPGEHYTWNKTTGQFTVTVPFAAGERFTFQFDPLIVTTIPAAKELWSSVLIVTANTTLTATDLEKKIIIEGSSGYLEVTLPDISVIPENKLIYIESSTGNHKCAAIKSTASNIKWMGTNSIIFICPNESIQMYRQGSNIRVHNADGNFKTVGIIVSEFSDAADVFNRVELNDALYDVKDYARLYDYVQKTSIYVPFDTWATGANRYKYSLANLDGKFHVPDIRNLYERASDGTLLPGTYQADMVGPHKHTVPSKLFNGATNKKFASVYDTAGDNTEILETDANVGVETRPKTYITRKFVLV